MKYFPEIDGLRGIAISLVIIFHSGLPIFHGGYIGVDVFFVISGFLITNIIKQDLEENKFSFICFYERRARRILPALFFVIAISTIISWIILPPADLVNYSKSLISIPLFGSNFYFMSQSSYFASNLQLKPLLHTWSLAVEEQFYILFPLLLVLIRSYNTKKLFVILLEIAIASFCLAQIGSIFWPTNNFYLLFTRAWEILIGSISSLAYNSNLLANNCIKSRNIITAFGMFLIIYSGVYFDDSMPFPSIFTLLPTTGAAIVILFAKKDTFVGKFLNHKIMIMLGVLSYSAYLWHHPIFAFIKYLLPSITVNVSIFLIFMVILLSIFTYYAVESPFRSHDYVTNYQFLLCSLLGSFLIIFIGFTTTKIEFKIEELLALILRDNIAVYAPNSDMNEREFVKQRVYNQAVYPSIIVVGSSRIMQIGQELYDSKLINLGVSGATIEDIIAITELARTQFHPSTIIIGVDPWLFNSASNQFRWKTLETEYKRAIQSYLDASNVRNQPALGGGGFSNVYLNKNNANSVGLNIYSYLNLMTYISSNCHSENIAKICRDGKRIYDIKYSSKSQDDIYSGFDDLIKFSMMPYDHSDSIKLKFEQFLSYISLKHRIVFILPPYHPRLYIRLKESHPEFIRAEQEFRELAASLNLTILGSYNPAECGCGEDEFYDGMHPKQSCMNKVISSSQKK